MTIVLLLAILPDQSEILPEVIGSSRNMHLIGEIEIENPRWKIKKCDIEAYASICIGQSRPIR